MSEQTKQTTVGDVAKGVTAVLKRGVEAIREGGAKIQKADMSPEHIKTSIANTTINKVLYYAVIVFAAWAAYGLLLKPLLFRKFR